MEYKLHRIFINNVYRLDVFCISSMKGLTVVFDQTEGVKDIPGLKLRAVVESHTFSKVEAPAFEVVGDLPGFRQVGENLSILIDPDQCVVEELDEVYSGAFHG